MNSETGRLYHPIWNMDGWMWLTRQCTETVILLHTSGAWTETSTDILEYYTMDLDALMEALKETPPPGMFILIATQHLNNDGEIYTTFMVSNDLNP